MLSHASGDDISYLMLKLAKWEDENILCKSRDCNRKCKKLRTTVARIVK